MMHTEGRRMSGWRHGLRQRLALAVALGMIAGLGGLFGGIGGTILQLLGYTLLSYAPPPLLGPTLGLLGGTGGSLAWGLAVLERERRARRP